MGTLGRALLERGAQIFFPDGIANTNNHNPLLLILISDNENGLQWLLRIICKNYCEFIAKALAGPDHAPESAIATPAGHSGCESAMAVTRAA